MAERPRAALRHGVALAVMIAWKSKRRRIWASVLIGAGVPVLSACNDPVARVTVGEIEFCVPRAEHNDVDYWWIPRDLPKGDGFLLAIGDFFQERPELYPARDIMGRTIPLLGRVTAKRESSGHGKPWPGHYFHTVAQILASEAVPMGGPYFGVYISAEKDAWHLWKVSDPDLARENGMKLSDAGSMVSICRITGGRLNVKYKPTSCSRLIVQDNVEIHTDFAFENLLRLEKFDAAIKSHVLGWKCKPD